MAYSFYRSLTIDRTTCGTGTFTDYPVAFVGDSTTDTWLKTVGNGGKVQSASGYDIAFFSDSALTTALKFERVQWTATAGVYEFYVKVPTVNGSDQGSNTVIYIAYGDAGIGSDQQDAANTWNSAYIGVWHLQEATGSNAVDSTSNGRTLTQTNSPVQGAGKLGGCLDFNGTTQNLASASTFATGSTSITLEMWISGDTIANANNQGVAKFGTASALDWAFIKYQATEIIFRCSTNDATLTPPANATWTYMAARTTATADAIYKNATTDAGTGTIPNNTRTFRVAHDDFAGYGYFDGKVDEVRLSNVDRGAQWLLTSYNNQNSPSTFYTIGAEIGTGSPTIDGWGGRRPDQIYQRRYIIASGLGPGNSGN